MNKEQLIQQLKYTKEKHKNDKLFTFDTDISAMCNDILDVLSRCVEIPDNATNEKVIDDIKVGDEVIVQVDKIGVVTGFDVLYDGVYVTTKDGWSDRFGKLFVKKTGRHFDEIENVLRQMRKGGKE